MSGGMRAREEELVPPQQTSSRTRTSRRAWRRDALRRRLLAGADCVSVLVLAASLGLASGSWVVAALTIAFLPFSILLAKLVGLYDADHRALRHLTVDELPRIFIWTVLTVAASLLVIDAFDMFGAWTGWVLISWLAFITAATVLRALARALRQAVAIDERQEDRVPSTKGQL